MKQIKKHRDLQIALSQWGAKKRISEKTGLSDGTLRAIQKGERVPNEGTLRLIAGALGLPEDTFLDANRKAEGPTSRRIVVELDIPEEADLTEAQLRQLRKAMLDAGRHILSVIKGLDAVK